MFRELIPMACATASSSRMASAADSRMLQPDFLAREMLADGRLVAVLDKELAAGGEFKALWPSSRHLSPKVRVFVDHLGKHLSVPASGQTGAAMAAG